MELQHGHAAEQVGAQQHPRRPPGGEGGQRQRDPAAPGHHSLHPQRRVDGRDVGPGQPAQRAAGGHRAQADAPHRIAQRVRRLGRLAHRAQHQPGARTVQKPHHGRRQRHGQVDQRMQLEQRRPDQRQVAQDRPGELRRVGQLGLHIADAQKSREAHAEQRQRQPRGVLVGVEPDHQHAEQRRQQRPGGHAGHEAQREAARMHHGGERRHGGAQHHALGPQVDDAGFFVDEQAQRGQCQHGAGAERGAQQQCVRFHQARPPRFMPTQRTR